MWGFFNAICNKVSNVASHVWEGTKSAWDYCHKNAGSISALSGLTAAGVHYLGLCSPLPFVVVAVAAAGVFGVREYTMNDAQARLERLERENADLQERIQQRRVEAEQQAAQLNIANERVAAYRANENGLRQQLEAAEHENQQQQQQRVDADQRQAPVQVPVNHAAANQEVHLDNNNRPNIRRRQNFAAAQ